MVERVVQNCIRTLNVRFFRIVLLFQKKIQHWSLFKHIEFKYGLTQFLSFSFSLSSYLSLSFSYIVSYSFRTDIVTKSFHIPLLSAWNWINSNSSKMYIFEIVKVLLPNPHDSLTLALSHSFSMSTFAHHFLIWFKQIQCNRFLALLWMLRIFLC